MKQLSFASLDFIHKKKRTRREQFLAEMEQVVPWKTLLSVVEPHYPQSGLRGGQPMPLETMLRVHLMQQWFGLSDPGMEDALYEIESMRRFAGLSLHDDRIPDESTILQFRHRLEQRDLGTQLFGSINAHLREAGIGVSKGTMVDATIIHASPSTKNREKQRDPEMHQTRKGQQWYFGMKIHAGADVDSGTAHTVTVTAANQADINELPNLLREDDEACWGDAAYDSDEYKRGARHLGISWQVNDRRKPGKRLSSSQKKRNRQRSSIRARVEHLFRIIKCQFGFRKVRYRGLKKNTQQVMTLMGLANLYLVRQRLAPSCA